jgi:AcrR family transcriptional regulator
VGARRGLSGASLDEIAEEAGFTKGAVYANFASKDELFLAVLDTRFDQRLAELEHVFATDETPETQAAQAGAGFTRAMAADPDWHRLFLDFTARAARDDAFRAQMAQRYLQLRDRIATMLERRAEQAGLEPTMPVLDVAMMTFAMANGVALEGLLLGDEVPADLLGRMFVLLAEGVLSPRSSGQR